MTKMVKLEDETYEELSSIGQFKETYDDIVKRLLATYRKGKENE